MPLQQNNDLKHKSSKPKEWFLEKEISVVEWPGKSPNLTSMEKL